MKLASIGLILKKVRRYFSLRYQIFQIKQSGLFDAHYYMHQNPDVPLSGLSPAHHYLKYGGKEGRKASQVFHTGYYLESNPDVKSDGINPLLHYIRYGIYENRNPNEEFLFTPRFKNKFRKWLVRVDVEGKQVLLKLIHNKNIDLIRNSSYFDSYLYLNINPDIKNAGIDPAMHYLVHGWKEGRSPGTRFDPYFYLNTYPDVRDMKINPLLHFLIFGEKEGRLPKHFEEDQSRYTQSADIRDLHWPEKHIFQIKVAIVCHVYYMDILENLWPSIQNMPIPFDLYLTTSEENNLVVEQFLSDRRPEHQTQIVVCPNRGRDIAPFLQVFEKYLTQYEVVCKIHTKKSTHDLNLAGWGKHLTTQLLGHPSVIYRILYEFEKDASLGMVWPVVHQYIEKLNLHRGWGVFSDHMKQKARNIADYYNLDITRFPDDFAFPAGSMFWFRPEALRALLSKPARDIPFEEEKQQIDGTIAHVYERLFEMLSEKAGFTHKTVYFDPELLRPGKIQDKIPKGLRSRILFISHDFVMAGAQKILLEMVTWFNKHTAIEACVLGIQKGSDGGRLLKAFEDIADVYLWENLVAEFSIEGAAHELIEKTGKIDLIYGNTLVAASLFPHFRAFGIPFITHVHELEHSIQTHIAPSTLQSALDDSALFIACSAPVKENLLKNHVKDPDKVSLVHEFITPKPVNSAGKMEIRKALHLPEKDLIVWGCGTISHRKGADLFIQTAITLMKSFAAQNVKFIWIGDNLWDMDNMNETSWEEWLGKIKAAGLEDRILFAGVKENPRAWFEAGDVFYLPSREDPFPLVCLEAADCRLPIICYEDAGGMPDFVEKDAGVVVPFLDTEAAANAIAKLMEDITLRIEKGRIAREKLLQKYTIDIAVPEILTLCRKVMHIPPPVSVIVPVYNHAPYLDERMESILHQTFRDYEIIVLDDASTDNSLEVAMKYSSHPQVHVDRNEINSGSPSKQWCKGVEMAQGELIWIAEGDDVAKPTFLEVLIQSFIDPEIVMAYTASNRIDGSGHVIQNFYYYNGHYQNLAFPATKWSDDYVYSGEEEVKYALAIRNTIPNASAVLFLKRKLESINWSESIGYSSAGDWNIYTQILKQGKIAYKKVALNDHRIHSTSVVAENKKDAASTISDYFKMHLYVLKEFDIPRDVLKLMIHSVSNQLRKIWPELSDEDFKKMYDVAQLEDIFEQRKISK